MKEKVRKPIRAPLLAAFAVVIILAAAAVTKNALSQKAYAEELAWKNELANLTWEQLAADPERYDVMDPRSLNALFFGQVEGRVCTHDETFSEPVIPDGKYYPNGDPNAEYYLEITGDKMCYRDKSGNYWGRNSGELMGWYGEREYKVITTHFDDIHMLCAEWKDAELLPGCPYLDKYSPIYISSEPVDFDDSGKAYIRSCFPDPETREIVKLYTID